MTVRNDLDRFDLVSDVIDRVPAGAREALREVAISDALGGTRATSAHGEDMPEIRDWRWPGPSA